MAKNWPKFETKDLGDTEADQLEMDRRWHAYDRDMKALIAAGGVHQDEDGWWINDATGELIGPDPDIERPLTDEELAQAKPFAEALPELAAAMKRGRGRPPVDNPKQQVTMRLDGDLLAKMRDSGPGWQVRANELLRKGFGL